MSAENTPTHPQGVRRMHTEMVTSYSYTGETPRTTRAGSMLLYVLSALVVGATYVAVPYQVNTAATLAAMSLVIAIATPWHLWCAGLDQIYPRPELDAFQHKAILQGARVILTDHGYVFHDPLSITDRLRTEHEAKTEHETERLPRLATTPSQATRETPAAPAPAPTPRPAPTPVQDPAQLRADAIAQIQADVAALDQYWLEYQLDPQDYYLGRPLLRDPHFAAGRDMHQAWDLARRLAGALTHHSSQNQVHQARAAADRAHQLWISAGSTARARGTGDMDPATAAGLRRVAKLVTALQDPTLTRHERDQYVATLRREIDRLGPNHLPEPLIRRLALPAPQTQQLLRLALTTTRPAFDS